MAEMGNKRLCKATAGIFHAPRRDEHLASHRGLWLELPQLFPPLSPLFHPGQPARAQNGERMRMLDTERGDAGRRGEEEGHEGRGGTGSLSAPRGRKVEGGGSRRGEGTGAAPFPLKAAFQMEMAGSAAALGQWPLRCALRGHKGAGGAAGEPRSAPPGPAAATRAQPGRSPGARGHQNCLEEC